MSSEVQPLLRQPDPVTSRVSFHFKLLRQFCSKNICLPSKAAILIILWTILVGTVYSCITTLLAFSIHGGKYTSPVDVGLIGMIPHAVLAIISTLYPLSGFIADNYCGRFKTVVLSTTFILLSLLMCGIVTLMISVQNEEFLYTNNHLSHSDGILGLVLFILAIFLFVIGIAGYQANYIQLGLDQLLEAPSEYLGLFCHWAIWSFDLTSIVIIALASSLQCLTIQKELNALKAFFSVPLLLIIVLLVLLCLSYWKRHWFYSEPGQYNPYKMVFKVLKFAKKHKHPLRRSAFTFSDADIPSRLDFAKERFGGPYTTEQVENVKTLFRLLFLLLSLGPVYILLVPTSLSVFPLFGHHIGHGAHIVQYNQDSCALHEISATVVETGGLTALLSSILMPLYIWFVYSARKRKPLKILTRLKLGIILCCLGVFSMFVIDIIGHSVEITNSLNDTEIQCMFLVIKQNSTAEYKPLNMDWSVLIPTSLIFAIGPPIIKATTLEFISAQSPHQMKGLLVGVSFAIQGFFQLCGHLTVLPLSLTHPWVNERVSPVISCGSSYLLFTGLVGLTGLILFSIMARKYKYRERDDEKFSQMQVEEVYGRYLTQRNRDRVLVDELTD